MVRLMMGLTGLVVAVAVLNLAAQQPKVGAMAPHPLDGAFERGSTPDEFAKGLRENDFFKKAVAAAVKAKKESEERSKEKPRAAPTPAQAARVAFLKALS